jgi:transcriptional regulator with XRE-family HTH domain
MSLIVGPQLRAARAMAGLDQEALAKTAGVAANTIRRLEGMPGRLRATTTTLDALQRALEEAGVEFIGGDKPGVRVSTPSAA